MRNLGSTPCTTKNGERTATLRQPRPAALRLEAGLVF